LGIYPGPRIFLLSGDLGSGKTTFVKAFCEILGCEEPITSPTFNIVHEYTCAQESIYHFDLYRLRNAAELEAIGFEEYLGNEKAFVFIEWPELAMPFLEGEEYLLLNFIFSPEGGRNISAELHEKS
jgi:tRNA threonylcarbamoyladenosine biosynthesis protein TsaE